MTRVIVLTVSLILGPVFGSTIANAGPGNLYYGDGKTESSAA